MSEPSRPQRLLDIVAFLLGHRQAVPVHRLLSELPGYRDDWTSSSPRTRAAARRKFERDKAALADMGIPLKTVEMGLPGTEESTGYRLTARDLYLPDLRIAAEGSGPTHPDSLTLSSREATAVLSALRRILELPSVPLRHEARMALRKLTFDLDPAAAPALPVRLLDRPGGADPEGVLPELMDAVHRRKRITVDYHSIGRDARARRELEPWGLLFQWGCWYLAGVPVEGSPGASGDRSSGAPSPAPPRSGGVRLFRVDRMSAPEVNGQRPATPDFQVPDDFSLGDRADRRPWELGRDGEDGQTCIVRFLGPSALLARRNGWGAPLAPRSEDGALPPAAPMADTSGEAAPALEPASGESAPEHESAEELRAFQVVRVDPFLRWILARRGEAQVVDPLEVRAQVAALARKVARQGARQASRQAPPQAGEDSSSGPPPPGASAGAPGRTP